MKEGAAALVAEFTTPDALCAAVGRLRAAGYRNLHTYTPHPVDGLEESVSRGPSLLPVIGFFGGLVGAVAGALMQYLPSAQLYPINIGGRPLAAWPAFGPTLFEITMAGAVLTVFFGLFAAIRLPRPYDPMFTLEAFERASQDRYFVAVELPDPATARAAIAGLLERHRPCALHEVRG